MTRFGYTMKDKNNSYDWHVLSANKLKTEAGCPDYDVYIVVLYV